LETVLPGAALRSAIRDGDVEGIATPVDLLGVPYYTPFWVAGSGAYVSKRPTTMAWWLQVYRQGLYDVLTRVRRDYGDFRLLVTENGMPRADRLAGGGVDDTERMTFLRDHLAAAYRAVQGGVRLDGDLVWSVLDNFEWAEGYAQRWGLVYVDYPTQRRAPKASARWFRDVVRCNGI
jgi:beta-glucosidase